MQPNPRTTFIPRRPRGRYMKQVQRRWQGFRTPASREKVTDSTATGVISWSTGLMIITNPAVLGSWYWDRMLHYPSSKKGREKLAKTCFSAVLRESRHSFLFPKFYQENRQAAFLVQRSSVRDSDFFFSANCKVLPTPTAQGANEIFTGSFFAFNHDHARPAHLFR